MDLNISLWLPQHISYLNSFDPSPQKTYTDGSLSDTAVTVVHSSDGGMAHRSRTFDQRSPRSETMSGGGGGGGGIMMGGSGGSGGGGGGAGGGGGGGGREADRFGTGMGKKSSSTSQLSATGNTNAGNYLLQYFLYLFQNASQSHATKSAPVHSLSQIYASNTHKTRTSNYTHTYTAHTHDHTAKRSAQIRYKWNIVFSKSVTDNKLNAAQKLTNFHSKLRAGF